MDIEISVAQFERMMKNIILLEYSSYIPNYKKLELKNTKLIFDESSLNEDNFQCAIVRSIFKHLINVNCNNQFIINDENIEVFYGEYLTRGLVEYYTFSICTKYSAEYEMNNDSIENFEFVRDLSEFIDLNKFVFTEDANVILDKVKDLRFKKVCDTDALEKAGYLNKKEIVSDKSDSDDAEVFIVYRNGKQFIKVIDNEGYVYYFKCDKDVFEIYKKLISTNNLNAKNFFKVLDSTDVSFELIEKNTAIKEESNVSYVNDEFEGVVSNLEDDDLVYTEPVLDTVSIEESNENIDGEINIDKYTSDFVNSLDEEDEEIDINNYTNNELDVVYNLGNSLDYNVEYQNIENSDSNDVDSLINEDNSTISVESDINISEIHEETISDNISADISKDDIISEQDYEAICMKAIKGKELTPEEYEKMELFDKYYYGELEKAEKRDKNEIKSKESLDVKNEDVSEQNVKIPEEKNKVSETTTEELKEKPKKKKKLWKILMWIIIIIITIYIGMYLGEWLFRLKEARGM